MFQRVQIGRSVQLAADLTDALAVAPAQPPNAVLADYHLDRENGLDLVVALRRHYGQTTPAILITADRSPEVREAAVCCGMSRLRLLRRIELPLAWPGIVSALVLTFAHTLGEFGVVLMVGGNLPGRTRTVSIAIYDQVQAMDYGSAARTAALLLIVSFLVLTFTYALRRHQRKPWTLI